MQQFRFGQLARVSAMATLTTGLFGLLGTVAAQNVAADSPASPPHRWAFYGQQLFSAARRRFQEIDSVSGNLNDAPPGILSGSGLGPRFNMNSCSGCHAQPAVGGTNPRTDPQVAMATLDRAKNGVPSFITTTGAVREARFVRNLDGTPDGGVHDLFVISGRTDAPGCTITQPDFAAALAQNNVIFRIPTLSLGSVWSKTCPTAASRPTRRPMVL